MVTLSKSNLVISITGSEDLVVNTFLRVFLAKERLTNKQLEITTALVSRYAEYAADGVIEPYASTLLFATDVRKEICKALGISPAHLNNTFIALTKKNILAKEAGKYAINPGIIPNETLMFKFKIT